MHFLTIKPNGRIFLVIDADGAAHSAISNTDLHQCQEAFSRSNAAGLISLASLRGHRTGWPADFAFWREFVDFFLSAFAHQSENEAVPMPPTLSFTLALQIPGTPGGEYARPAFFTELWKELDVHVKDACGGDAKKWLNSVNPSYHLLGKVTFHLAENKRTPDTPFAFLATYTHRMSAQEKPVHLPLSKALQEYAGAKNQSALRSLLEPVQLAVDRSKWVADQLESKNLFQAQAWKPHQAYAFLKEISLLEECGIMARIPNWWQNKRGPRAQVSVSIGSTAPGGAGLSSMLDFSVNKSFDGKPLTPSEWKALMSGDAGLVSLRGQWVEADPDKLRSAMEHWQDVRDKVAEGGISFLEAMRLLAGTKIGKDVDVSDEADPSWSRVTAGDWLRQTLESLRDPSIAEDRTDNRHLKATLRRYQEHGVQWLRTMTRLQLGACLADDMGLGKTIQVIALLLQIKHSPPRGSTTPDSPSLLVVPASLMANWRIEMTRFAPSLSFVVMHPSETMATHWREEAAGRKFIAGKDVVITTYSQIVRTEWLGKETWHLLILDEAQAIKNPSSKQTQAVKKIPAVSRIALSGTPVENSLGDLWSLYDFLNRGLLGTAAEFSRYVKALQNLAVPDFSPLRSIVQPYLLRRLKTDRSIITDLPDKTEMTSWCLLAKRQAALYQKSVESLKENLETMTDGIQRRGLVLSYLMRFKQICNHPSHWTNDGVYDEQDSGKFHRLRELCEEIASRQEKVLVFTQFREMTEHLATFLRGVFARPGLILHGSTPIKQRQNLVADFQRDDGPPFFVLSLKAGGTGLTLTGASHVIHFDRWWNPAVENQATDRAYRIGQKKNVLVHKFVCRGTIEERIHELIAGKADLADSILGGEGGAEKHLTEMGSEELLSFVALDLSAIAET